MLCRHISSRIILGKVKTHALAYSGYSLNQVLFGLLRVGALVPILSDAMIRGFTTGAAFHVFTSQIKYVFGIDMPIITGPFRMVRVRKQ